jgi:hypothetical protein
MRANATEFAERRTKQNTVYFPTLISSDTMSIQTELLQCSLESLIVYLVLNILSYELKR